MSNNNIFNSLDEKNKKQILNTLQSRTVNFKKYGTIASYISTTNYLGIIEEGEADLVRYDYSGRKTLVEHLKAGSIFGGLFTPSGNNELYVIASKDCKVTFIDYPEIIKSINKGKENTSIFIDNLLNNLADKLISLNERIEILSQRSIREKLLTYFNQNVNKTGKKSFTLEFTFTDLADYLSVDRSAMTREIKNLKEEGFIKVNKKQITLLY